VGSVKPGEVVGGRFEIEREAGSGGMAVVHKGRDRLLGSPVAIKLLSKQDPREAERFEREAAMLSRLSDPTIVSYVAHGRHEGTPYVVMEWLEGETLARRLLRGRLRLDEALDVGTRLARALATMHRHQIIHRDVKPSNVFLPGGNFADAKLADLGIARPLDALNLTATGIVVGTPLYMAPEQAAARDEVDQRVDLYALGCVLYECLSGQVPFHGDRLQTVLAKILLQKPQSLKAVLPQLPEAVDTLVARLLAKKPAERPADAPAVERELSRLRLTPAEPSLADDGLGPGEALTLEEQRVLCVVLAGPPPPEDYERDSSISTESQTLQMDTSAEAIRDQLATTGARIDVLADGSLLMALSSSGTAIDEAQVAARAALTLYAARPGTRLAVATGRAEVFDHLPVGAVVESAAALLGQGKGVGIAIDAATAALLEQRFVVAPVPGESWFMLQGEKELPSTRRTVLGRPTRCVGREPELALLEGTLAQCIEDEAARVVLMTAPAGAGKSRLAAEFLERVQARHEAVVLLGRGDSFAVGSPFGVIAPAIRRAAGILSGEPAEVQGQKLSELLARSVPAGDLPRLQAYLGELIGIPSSPTDHPAMRVARQQPQLMADGLLTAWEDWLSAMCRQGPVLLVLDDLQWGDVPSVKYIDAALRRLESAPFMVLALARPEVHERFSDLWDRRNLHQMRLGLLSRRASERMVRQALGPDASDDAVARVVTQAEGNAFYLEELVRAVAAGSSSLPDTVLATVQARLDAFGPAAKRVLRAASIFGEVFWEKGLVALIGGPAEEATVQRHLQELVSREVIVRRDGSTLSDQTEYAFAHTLVQGAAYAMLTETDRTLGHRLAGEWLASAHGADPLVLAEHLARGNAPAGAVHWYGRAAEQALIGNDLIAALQRTRLGQELGATGEDRAALLLLEAEALGWLGSHAEASRSADEATQLCKTGTAGWFHAVGQAILSSGRAGQVDDVGAWVQRLRQMAEKGHGPGSAAIVSTGPDADPDGMLDVPATSALVVSLCRSVTQLLFAGQCGTVDQIFALLPGLIERVGDPDPIIRAQLAHARAVRCAYDSRIGPFLLHARGSVQAFDEAGDTRNAGLERATLARAYGLVGDFRAAELELDQALAYGERVGARQARLWSLSQYGLVRGLEGRHAEACQLLDEAVATSGALSNFRLQGWALANRARFSDDPAAAAEAAQKAAELLARFSLRPLALAVQARALVKLGRAPEALALAEEAVSGLSLTGGLIGGDIAHCHLALAEAQAATGHPDQARLTRDRLAGQILAWADTLAPCFPGADGGRWKEGFLKHPDHRAVLEGRA
jgi:serine/threonine protein kinase/tetratricopeptide (TPR) repeat protein